MTAKKIVLIGLLPVFLLAASASAAILGVPETFQEQDQWCWAGSSQGTLWYYGTYVDQCTIANFARLYNGWGSTDCCSYPWSGTCNQANYMFGTSGSLQNILQNWGVGSTASYTYLTSSQVDTEISNGHPFVIRWGWDSGGGHFVVGRGYDSWSGIVYYMDPWPGNGYSMGSYSWMVWGSSHTWTHTLTTWGGSSPNPDPGGYAYWGVYNTVCCYGGSGLTFTGDLDGRQTAATTYGCSFADWSGYTYTSAGAYKTFYWWMQGNCLYDSGSWYLGDYYFSPDACYYFQAVWNGAVVIYLYRDSGCYGPSGGKATLVDSWIVPGSGAWPEASGVGK